jgi:cell division protein ZapA (FtsZ GTPase activity inhibitor)
MMNDQRLTNLENQLSEATQRFDSQLSELRQQQQVNTNSIVGLNQAVQSLLEVIRVDREIAREDRVVARQMQSDMREMQSDMREMQSDMREMRSEIRGLQLECQRIWEYLLRQQGNGNRPS